MKDLAKGDVSMMFDPCNGALPVIREGKLTALAVASPTRLADRPISRGRATARFEGEL